MSRKVTDFPRSFRCAALTFSLPAAGDTTLPYKDERRPPIRLRNGFHGDVEIDKCAVLLSADRFECGVARDKSSADDVTGLLNRTLGHNQVEQRTV